VLLRAPVLLRITKLRNKLHSFVGQLSYLPQTVRIIWVAARGWTIAWAILLMVQGLLPAATVYLTRSLVDNLVVALRAGSGSWQSMQPTLLLAALMAVALLLGELLQSVGRWVGTAQAELIRDHLSGLIHGKSVAVDLAFYESPEYHDQLERVRNELSSRPLALLESTGSFFQTVITLVAMGTLIIPYGAWLPLVLLASTLPAFFVVLSFNQRYHDWWNHTTSARRRAQYYEAMLTTSPTAAELRLFDLGAYFQSAYQTLRGRLRRQRVNLTRDQTLAQLGAGLVGLVMSGAAMFWMVWRALHGLVTLGDLALFYQAFNRGQNLMEALLASMGQIYNNTLFLGNLFEFLDLKSQVVDPPNPSPVPAKLSHEICFRGVTFRYPGSERCVLKDFGLSIPAGQIVALVGPNGAGKSTLVKLLCRFYDPDSGRIEVDGTDIRNLSLKELRSFSTVLFQWPVHYQASAAENIALSDLPARSGPLDIETAARAAGAHDFIASLPEGYKTHLGKWFSNGTDLSTGEWQRLALARAFLRRAQLIILDEPTSALDSWAEADWFERFRNLAQGRTAIIITHRLPIARRADMIHVMNTGGIVESGTHDELLRQGGLYAQSWLSQMEAHPGSIMPGRSQKSAGGRH
jgi:ATP-binding cassette subfamily B protein